MKWAFWRSETGKGGRANAAARPEKEARDPDVERVDEAAALRTQARRRLIGADFKHELLVQGEVTSGRLDFLRERNQSQRVRVGSGRADSGEHQQHNRKAGGT